LQYLPLHNNIDATRRGLDQVTMSRVASNPACACLKQHQGRTKRPTSDDLERLGCHYRTYTSIAA